MKLTKTKLRQIIKEEIESEGLGDSITKAFRSNVGQGAGAGAIAGLGLATALAGPAGAGIALPLIAMANGATVGALTGMIGDDLLDRATETWQKLGDEAKVQLKNMGKKIGLSENQGITRKQMKLTKTKLQEIIKEELSNLIEDDYDENSPSGPEMMADAMQDGLSKLIPGYDRNKDMENLVHDSVFAFAKELHELMNFPIIKVDPERYFGPDDKLKEG